MINDVDKNQVLSNIEKFCKAHNLKFKKYKKYSLAQCPYCSKESANIIPNTNMLNCWKCDTRFNIADAVRDIYLDEPTEEKIYDYLIEKLDLDIQTTKESQTIQQLLDYYSKNQFDMVPISKRTKIPSEKKWTSDKIKHKDKQEWLQWVSNNLNIGVKPGDKSGITIIDIDILSKEEKIILRQNKKGANKKNIDLTLRTQKFIKEMENKRERGLENIKSKLKDIMGDPVIQKTLGGEHWFYKYEAELPKCGINLDNIHIDIENDGGYVLIAPSQLFDEPEYRYFEELKEIPKMPTKLLDYLKGKLPKTQNKETYSEQIREAIQDENFKIDPAKFKLINDNLKGCCNLEMIKLGGKFRKGLSPKDTEFALKIVNKHMLEEPMDYTSINNMCQELNKYYYADVDELEEKILDYMKQVNVSTKADIELSIEGRFTKGEGKKRLNKVLQKLEEEDKLKKVGKKEYKYRKKIQWVDTLFNLHKPVNYKIPYFGDVCNFNIGDHVIVGSKTGHGKTILAMNIVKRFVDQGIKPYYIGREGGSRWVEDAWALGLKDGDVFYPSAEDFFEFDELELNDKSVVIYDWYNPQQYKNTGKDFDKLDKILKKFNSFAIVFVQLRRENNAHFAKDQILNFATFGCKYIYDDDDGTGNRGEYTKFEINKNRSPKNAQTAYTPISCRYNFKNKRVETIAEYERRTGE